MSPRSWRMMLGVAVVADLVGWSAVLAGEGAAPAPQRAETNLELFDGTSTWNFNAGTEFPGAQGAYKLDKQQDKAVGVLSYDFTGGGLYVAATTNVHIPETASELRFKVQSKDPIRVLVRLTDHSGQTHQWQLPYAQAGKWATLRVALHKPTPEHWGGANDGMVAFPGTMLWLGVAKSEDANAGKKGEALFSDVITIDKK